MMHRWIQKEDELYTILVTRYGPRISYQRKRLKSDQTNAQNLNLRKLQYFHSSKYIEI